MTKPIQTTQPTCSSETNKSVEAKKSLFKERIKDYKKKKYFKDNGIDNCLSFSPFLPKLSKIIPGLVKGTYYAITSFTNVGKTPLAKFLFVLIPLYWAAKGKKIKVMYFCLEESREQFYDSMVCSKLYRETKKKLSILQLNSMFDAGNIDEETLNQVETFSDYFEMFDKNIEVISHLKNPTGIYKHIRDYAKENGKFYYKGQEVEQGGDSYIPNNSDEYVIIVTDHINLLQPEKNADTLAAAMQRFSSEYMLAQVCSTYNYVVCSVHQQAAEGEGEAYKNHTNNEASLATLGDNRKIQRDYMVVMSLDMPQKHNISVHRGVDIGRNGGIFYRGFRILKNRFGLNNVSSPLILNPFECTFTEINKT